MSERLFALLVHDHPEPFECLKRVLRDLSVETYSVKTCKEAEDLLTQFRPHLIFTENALPDGSWVDILDVAGASNVPLNVIVVGAFPDTHSYLSAMERGAFDFVTPPFEREPLSFVVRSAELDARRRREATAITGVA